MLNKIRFFLVILVASSATFVTSATSIEVIFAEPVIREMSMSPDGEHLVGIGKEYFQFKDTKTLGSASPSIVVDRRQRESIRDVWWINNERVLYTVDQIVDPSDFPWWPNNFYSVMVDGRRHSNPFNRGRDDWEIQLEFVDRYPGHNKSVLMLEKRFANYRVVENSAPSIIQMDTYAAKRGKRTGRQRGPVGYGRLAADRDGIARVAWGTPQATPTMHYRSGKNDNWRDITADAGIGVVGASIEYIGFDRDNKGFYIIGNHENGIRNLYRFSPDEETYEVAFGHDEFDILRVQWTSDRSEILGVTLNDSFGTFIPLAPKHKANLVWNTLRLNDSFKHMSLEVVDSTPDGNRVLLFAGSTQHPGAFYIYDNNSTPKVRLVTKTKPDVLVTDMTETQTYAVKTPDDLLLYVNLTIPRADGPVPMVVLPHAGPISVNDGFGFNEVVQAYASHGYAVLQVNYRGSSGRGRDFESRGYQEWGGKIIDDILLATKFGINQSAIDGERVCIAGDGYGAFAALAAAIREPTMFKCAVGNQGIYDLAKMWSGQRSTWILVPPEILNVILGRDMNKLAAESPANNADKLNIPVFLSHGGKDGFAPIQHHRAMVTALRANNVEHEEVDEIAGAHAFRDPENRARLYTRILDFVGKHI